MIEVCCCQAILRAELAKCFAIDSSIRSTLSTCPMSRQLQTGDNAPYYKNESIVMKSRSALSLTEYCNSTFQNLIESLPTVRRSWIVILPGSKSNRLAAACAVWHDKVDARLQVAAARLPMPRPRDCWATSKLGRGELPKARRGVCGGGGRRELVQGPGASKEPKQAFFGARAW